jgi:hypothetical protein
MAEYRRDWSNHLFFPSGLTGHSGVIRIRRPLAWYGGMAGSKVLGKREPVVFTCLASSLYASGREKEKTDPIPR